MSISHNFDPKFDSALTLQTCDGKTPLSSFHAIPNHYLALPLSPEKSSWRTHVYQQEMTRTSPRTLEPSAVNERKRVER